MKHFLTIIALLISLHDFANPGDTIVVQTISNGWPLNPGWNSPMQGKFIFPPDTVRFEKILMYYNLKCNPAQSPACGEWDYLTYTNLWEHTNTYDSTMLSHPNFTINGTTPDSLPLINQLSYSYNPHFQYQIIYTDTLSLSTFAIGSDTVVMQTPFGTGNPDSRCQFLWRKSELLATGMLSGYISGIQLFLNTTGGFIKNLTIKIRNYSIDSVNSPVPVISGLTTVYSANTVFSASGWNNINFTTPFLWNENSNLLMDVSFDETTSPYTFIGENTTWASSIHSSDVDYYLDFDGSDFVSVPASVFTDIDSAITISFWQYGDPDIQPHDEIIFEGLDSAGNRVVNAHLPWGDGKVYWDAGNTGADYDRVIKTPAGTSQYEGKWNYWTFTKDAVSGFMRIYLNGALVLTGGNKFRLMKGIRQFRIGSGGSGTWNFYNGMIDEFSIWDEALDLTTIKGLMYQEITGSHPMYPHLKGYFKFNDGSGTHAMNEVQAQPAYLAGYPEWKNYEGERIKKFNLTNERPNIIFEQGNFTSHFDSTLLIDTLLNPPAMVVLFNDTLQPNIATDTIYRWFPYYQYSFDNTGQAIDSVYFPADTIIYRIDRNYFSAPFEKLNKFELGRYITPYGNGLDLGPDGWTWIFDVSDFRPLLKDTVDLSAGNFQELLDLKFYMIKGTPPRDVIKIENVWQGDFALNDFVNLVPAKTITLDTSSSMFKLRTTVTGHQFDNATNCAEFCPKTHSLYINGVPRYSWQIIQDCARNPLYPQGGTWIYNRAGWCPGMPGTTQHLELTPYISGSQVTVDYNAQFDNYGNYVTESQLVSYGMPNFTVDAALEDIISPSRYELHGRVNPICGRPVVKIKNTGSTVLTSLDISYKFEGDTFYHYHWTGNLGFLATADVALPSMNWGSPFALSKKFTATISNPNGQQYQYPYNNTMGSRFELSPIYNQSPVINFKSNSFASENKYEVRDANGTVVHTKQNFTNNTTYFDTLDLAPGCYEFIMYDTDDDGIAWWANSDGTGYLKILLQGGTVAKIFNPDFGAETRFYFSVSEPTGSNYLGEIPEGLTIYPNPSRGIFTVDFSGFDMNNTDIQIYNLIGQTIYQKQIENTYGYKHQVDISHSGKGIYFIKTRNGKRSWNNKIVVE